MDGESIVALITAPSKEVAERIARALVENRLAACVNLVAPIRSIYTWEGKTCDEEEVLLVVKTTLAAFEGGLMPLVTSLHPYQVPEIIALPIVRGSRGYLEWIERATRA
jgi:periplasmic divalent cation tolerance protein